MYTWSIFKKPEKVYTIECGEFNNIRWQVEILWLYHSVKSWGSIHLSPWEAAFAAEMGTFLLEFVIREANLIYVFIPFSQKRWAIIE